MMTSSADSSSPLFTLPPEIRDDIYKRVLVVTPQLYLFQEPGGQKIGLFAPERPRTTAGNDQWLSLLYVSRKVHNEAAAVFYRSHQFILVDTTAAQVRLLESFLDRIGLSNAGHLSHICINFPATATEDTSSSSGAACSVPTQKDHMHPGRRKPRPRAGLFLREDGIRSLELLQERCTHLVTLETYLHTENSGGLTDTSYDSSRPEHVREVLSQINSYLKAIPSLQNVLVRVYAGPLHVSVVSWMHEFGWDVSRGR